MEIRHEHPEHIREAHTREDHAHPEHTREDYTQIREDHAHTREDHIHQELIPRAASFFKVVGDETRMKILCTIAREELCVNDIAEKVAMTKSAVSHQLKLLKDEDLVKSRRDGKNIFYSLDDQHVLDIIEIAFTHIEHKSHGADCTCSCCRGEE